MCDIPVLVCDTAKIGKRRSIPVVADSLGKIAVESLLFFHLELVKIISFNKTPCWHRLFKDTIIPGAFLYKKLRVVYLTFESDMEILP